MKAGDEAEMERLQHIAMLKGVEQSLLEELRRYPWHTGIQDAAKRIHEAIKVFEARGQKP